MKIIKQRKVEIYIAIDEDGFIMTNKKPYFEDNIYDINMENGECLESISDYNFIEYMKGSLKLERNKCYRAFITIEEEVECESINNDNEE